MLSAIATKTGLAAGVDIATFRPYVQDGVLLSASTPAEAMVTTTAKAEVVDESKAAAAVQQKEDLSPEVKAEMKTAVMLVSHVS